MKKLSDLENSASCDAAVREQIAALPPEVSDISQLAKISGKLIIYLIKSHYHVLKLIYGKCSKISNTKK